VSNQVLAGKRTIVTGAANGIGQATARLFASEGALVALFDIDAVGGQGIRTDIVESGGTAIFLQVDMTDPAGVDTVMNEVRARFEGIDVLVNVVGGSGRQWGDGPTADCTVEGWRRTVDLNLTSVFLGCKFAIPHLLNQKRSVILNIASVLGIVGGDADFATHAYATSKGAIISLTRSIAAYYAPQGLRANVIAPGLIATKMSRRALSNTHIRARLSELQPLTGDFGQPEDVAHAALYLASDAAKFVTGALLTVDGGWTTV
jgi:NAD(P)-dependent dehydrogenase (short-subunit alcohol dehydrogenase family)